MTEIAKLELDTITEFQRELHSGSSTKDVVSSYFYETFTKMTWFVHQRVILPVRTVDSKEVAYDVDHKTYHYLLFTSLRFLLPAIRVKKDYKGRIQICWCRNIGHNVINSATLNAKGIKNHIQKFDSHWLDQNAQYNMKKQRKQYNYGIGNVTFLVKCAEYLPEFPVNAPQPWF